MSTEKNILFTGGSGLLGRAVQRLKPGYLYPSSQEMDISLYQNLENFVSGRSLDTVVHAAAFTSPPKIDQEPLKGLETNIMGTANVVKFCRLNNCRLIYISTDYVFNGQTGNYKEGDPLAPVNLYAWSKLGGECAVRLHDKSLIVRTSFGPEPFPYPKAFTDQWTSRLGVSQFAARLARLIDSDLLGVIHVGGPRQTVYDYAQSVAGPGQTIGPLSVSEVNFAVPRDTSLDCSLYHKTFDE